MKKGRVYWITGLPGSGKTTIGTALYYKMRNIYDNIVILDGDILKQFVGDTVGYTTSARRERARKYSNICKLLSEQGMWVIICTVALFDEIREWNRKNIDGYIEVFLDVPIEVLQKRNKKGLYSKTTQNKEELFDNVEFPKEADLTIRNDKRELIDKYVCQIMEIEPKIISEYDRDRQYWNKIYKKYDLASEKIEPSDFAKSVIGDIMHRGGEILELGCGNGRDSLFFLENNLIVTAVDASDHAISNLQNVTKGMNATFVCDDFVKCEALYHVMYDSIYSRFTLHAINGKQENELLKNVKIALKENGRLYIEARTIHDDLYGKGRKVGENAFIYNEHYRRFIDPDSLKRKMEAMGFKIVSMVEDRGFSKTSNQDPMLLRLIAEII